MWSAMEKISPRYARRQNFSKCTPFKIKPFLKVYNILALFSDLPNRPVKYSIYVENSNIILTSLSFPGDYPAFVACSSLFENMY